MSADVVVTNVRVVGDFYHRIGARIGSLLLRNDRAEPLRLIRFELATDDVPAALELPRHPTCPSNTLFSTTKSATSTAPVRPSCNF